MCRPLAAMTYLETEMSIKGIREALAKKQKSQNPEQHTEDPDAKIIRPPPIKVTANKPQKRVTGRGR